MLTSATVTKLSYKICYHVDRYGKGRHMLEPVWALFDELDGNTATQSLLILIVLVQGGWILYNHLKRREFFPKIEFNCDILFKARSDKHWIAEIVLAVRNNGIVGHEARDLSFRIHGLKPHDHLEEGPAAINHQLNFKSLVKEGKWARRHDLNALIEAGTTQYYRHVMAIDANQYVALVVHGSMEYPQKRKNHFVVHTCNRLVRVPSSLDEADLYNQGERLRLSVGDAYLRRTVKTRNGTRYRNLDG